jgi:hypothetical protein
LKPRSAQSEPERLSAREKREKRQSIVMQASPGFLKTAIPAILTAVAVYISLVYASKLTVTFFETEKTDQLVRMDIGVTKQKPVLEQEPPPSPETVVRALAGTDDAQDENERRRILILEPEFEPDENAADPDQLNIQLIDLGPLPNPTNATDAAAGSTSKDFN